MGDKYRSEFQKPVKNTLLSGASHGFPFESFQGSSLLIPVSQDSPSVLNDSIGDLNKYSSNDPNKTEKVSQITEGVGMATLQDSAPGEESKSQPQTSSQGYTGLFSSFFGGGSQKKPETDPGQSQRKNSDQPSLSSVSSTPRSSSPFVNIPSVQSFSPALQVPLDQSQNEAVVKPIGFSHSVDSPFSQIHNQSQSGDGSVDSGSFQKIDLPSIPETAKQPIAIQNFFGKESNQNIGFGSQPYTSSLGFESFGSNMPVTTNPGPALYKAHSAMELGAKETQPPPPSASFFDSPPPASAVPQFYQTRSESADSFKPIQPPFGGAAPPSGPPLTGAPPMTSGFSGRNYRRDHHKRLAYAPVPGLTSNTAVSSSYLQPSQNLSLSSSALTSPSEPVKQPLSGSLSQPALNLSGVSSDLNISTSGQNFFTPQSFSSSLPPPPSTTIAQHVGQPPIQPPIQQPIQPTVQPSTQPVLGFVNPTPVSSTPMESNTSISTVSPVPMPSPPPTGPTFSSPAVHPPIMSTKEQTSTPTAPERTESPVIIPASLNQLANLGTSGIIYRPVYHHWFIKFDSKDAKEMWQPFSMTDSLALEQAFNSDSLTPDTVVPTDGGRYDVNVTQRIRTPVYWKGDPKTVRRCSWFYKIPTDSRLHPYDENTAYNLEEEYKKAVMTNSWNKKITLPSGDYIIMYGPSSMALFQNAPQTPEGWEAEPDYSQHTTHRAKIVKRGVLDDFEIEDGEPPNVDHLVFVVHGIGPVCDFKGRGIEEAVDCFRNKSLQLVRSHFRSSIEQGTANRLEVLPVSWHWQLHSDTTGVDRKLQTITLKSIPRLRNFTNDTLLDILFYTSPMYCQKIVQQVAQELNTLYAKFKSRNPNFKGGVSVVGHSLGSLILFDMLCHQKPPSPRMENIKEETKTNVEHEMTTIVSPDKKKRSLSRNVSYVMGTAGTGQPFIEYPQLSFQPVAFFAMGSPIGMFVTVRGIDSLGLEFCFPTCSRFFNIFHPFDPVAYRIEALVNPDLAEKRPVLIPHHKGRKRIHLELKETMARISADLKQRLVDSVRSTWNTVYQLTMFGRADDGLEQEVDKVIEKQLERQRTESMGLNEPDEIECNAGRLNMGRRVDYVLQEAPIESFNEYVFAVTSHCIYWDSDDTMLLILKEIYESMGVFPDSQQIGGQEGATTSPAYHDTAHESSHSPPPFYGFN